MNKEHLRLTGCLLIGIIIWFLPVPEGLTSTAWQYFAIFITVIIGFMMTALPMGLVVLLGILILTITGVAPLKETLLGYGDSTVWLVVAAFLIAGGVKETGLGKRIGLTLVDKIGKNMLGLGYAITGAELILGPVVPSNTARGGGILSPIVRSLSEALDSHPEDKAEYAGKYLMLTGTHANLITAAMFLTGMAANPLVAGAAKTVFDIDFSWTMWAWGALVPGLLGLLLLPPFLKFLVKPKLQDTRVARDLARKELHKMGPMTFQEKMMAGVFVLLILLWTTKGLHGMGTTTVALIGVCGLLITRTLSWDHIIQNKGAWDTLIWLGGLLAMANGLKKVGFIDWFAEGSYEVIQMTSLTGIGIMIGLGLIYFYSMYGFSMLTAHISAMVLAFMTIALKSGVPPLLSVAILAYFSDLCACLTNYSSGPVIIYFGYKYVKPGQWFSVGFIISLFHLVIWLGVGLLWWKLIGWW
jgi:DASS family divalent anion:Na+ symporter